MSMSFPVEAGYRVISGTRSLRSESRTSLGDALVEIQKFYGVSERQAAPMLGIDRRTWQRIKAGQSHGTPRTAGIIRRAQRRARLAGSRETRLRRSCRGLKMKATVRVSTDERTRILHIGRSLSDEPGVYNYWSFGPMIDAFLSGANETMGDYLALAVELYHPGMEVISVEWIKA